MLKYIKMLSIVSKQLTNDENQMKTILKFGMDSNLNIFVKGNSILIFFYFLDTENLQGLAGDEMLNKYSGAH